ncbi:pyridoxamine 5'-phosphate oxidase family protein [Actinomycetospora chlora]|uniref:Pyridoxamine 5'-phosphate oxidase family protein n=1 Tax=Actinomycetospora chlora TaxID=663608 RepID=A0ABP9A4V0_9PSEU
MDTGFHEGERAVQERAGTRADAERLGGMLDAPDLTAGVGRFLAERTFAAISARDADGRLWTSPLSGAPGFLRAVDATTLAVNATPPAGDPLHALPAGQPLGMLAIEFARRRRVRVNGTLTDVTKDGLTVAVEQAYGNCPRFIHPRDLAPSAPASSGDVRRGPALTTADQDLVTGSDTFLLGTTHPTRGNDASHRGGPAGFVHVTDPRTLWWPDYPGNNMFNSFGNLAVDPEAALLFLDFTTGATLHLSGTAVVDWSAAGDLDTGRRVEFHVEAVASGSTIPLRAGPS